MRRMGIQSISMDSSFIGSFPPGCRDSLIRASQSGIDGCSIGGIPCFFRGSLPDAGKAVLFASYGAAMPLAQAFYASALEAAISGWDAVNIAESSGNGSVLRGCMDGEGRLFIVTALPLMEYCARFPVRLRRALLTGGGVLSPGLDRAGREAAIELALSLSRFAVAGGGHAAYDIVRRAADRGMDAYILRASLAFPAMRRLYGEGCPVISSFSSASAHPEAIAYEECGGSYRFLAKEYGILSADEAYR